MIFALNTSTLQFGLALMDEQGTVRSECLLSKTQGHFGDFVPALQFLLENSGREVQDLTCVMVVTGPGSFTGLRVGLSAAKGLCHALEIPIIGVSSLEALAHQHPFPRLPVIPVLDSRKGEVFAAQFRWADHNTLVREKEDVSLQIEKLADGFQVPALFIGNDFAGQSPIISETLGTEAHLAPSHLWNLKASTVGALGLKRYHDRHFDDPHTLKPIYLRPPDIRPNPYGIRSGSGK